MVLGTFELGLLVGLPLLIGAGGLRLLGIGWRTDPLGYLGWAWLVGSLGLAGLELLRLLTHLGSPGPLSLTGLALAAGLYALGRRRALVAPAARGPESRVARFVFGLVLALALAVTVQRMLGSSWVAIVRDDEAIFWSKRAKLWFVDGFGPSYARAVATRDLANSAYPLLNPLLQLYVFDLAGKITHVVNRLPIQLCSLALFLCTASALRRAAGSWVAGGLLLALASSPLTSAAARHAHSDVLVALVAGDAFERWNRGGERAWLALASLGAAFLIWSKNEGLLLLTAFLCIQGFAQLRAAGGRAACLRPSRAQLLWLPIAAVLALTWIHNATFGASGAHTPSVAQLADLGADLQRNAGVVLRAFAQQAFAPSLHGVPAAFFLLLVLAPEARRGWTGAVGLALLFQYLGVAQVYLTKPDLSGLLDVTLSRVMFQVLPLQLLLLALVLRALLAVPGALPARFVGLRADGGTP